MRVEGVIRDVRLAIRVLRRSPIFSVTVVFTLAVAVGINTAVFSVIDGVLLRPLPYSEPERLRLVHATLAGDGNIQSMTSQHGVTWAVIRDHAQTVDRAVFSTWTSGINVIAANAASFAQQQRVGAGFFSVLGVIPTHGREFTPDEDRRGGPPAVILSHAYWRKVGGDPTIVGASITLRGQPHTVVGIMPSGFHTGVDADVWTPLRASLDGEGEGENYRILLRLRSGMTVADADAEMQRLGAEILRLRPAGQGTLVTFSTVGLQAGMTENLRKPLLMLWAAVAIVFLVACVNLSGLLLARASGRMREMATRLALGGGRLAIVRQLLAESVVLAVAGGGAGVVLATIALDVLQTAVRDMGVWQPLSIDARAAGVALSLSLVSSLFFGLAPAFQATRLRLQQALAGGGARTVAGGSSRWPWRSLVVAQVALGVVLLAGAALLVRTFTHLRNLEPGFDSSGVVAATVSLQDARYATAPQVARLVDTTLRQLNESSAVGSAAVSLGLPYERLLNLGFRHLDGSHASDTRGRMTSAAYVAGDYFLTLRIPVRSGRVFTIADTAASPGVVVVNETLARVYFDGEDPLGRRIAFAGREREIVGVVGDVQLKPGFGDHGPLAAMPLAYIPLSQATDGFLRLVHGWFSPSFVVRARGPSGAVVPIVRAALDTTDPLLPLAQVRSLDEVKATALSQPRMFMVLLGTLAGTAVLLAALGIHGLIASSVTERTRETGIRLALGATAGRAIRTLALPGIALAAFGIAAGAAVARAGVSLIRSFVWGVSPTDPWTFALVAALFLAIAALASVLPALRVLRMDPAATLRAE